MLAKKKKNWTVNVWVSQPGEISLELQVNNFLCSINFNIDLPDFFLMLPSFSLSLSLRPSLLVKLISLRYFYFKKR